jgi:hypothetical protein
MFVDYSGLVERLNEVAFIPQKIKYQFEELKEELIKEIKAIKLNNESKIREIDSYI